MGDRNQEGKDILDFAVAKGKKKEPKDTWWWNEDVQKAIKEKKEC